MWETFISSFCESWELLFRFPVPAKFRKMAGSGVSLDWLVKACFPLDGALVALIFYLLARLLSSFGAPIGCAIIFAILATIASEAMTGFSNLNALGYFITLRLAGADNQNALRNLQKVECNSLAVIAQVFVLLIKAVCFGLLFHFSHIYWLGIVFILSFTMQAQLWTLPEMDSDEKGMHLESGPMRLTFWFVAGFLCLLFFLKSPVLIPVSFAICVLSALSALAWLWRELGGANAVIISFFGYVLQLVLLLLGLMLS